MSPLLQLLSTGFLMTLVLFTGCAKKINSASMSLDATPKVSAESRSGGEPIAPDHPQAVTEKNLASKTGPFPENLNDIYFDFNSPTLRSDMKGSLIGDVTYLKTHMNEPVKIEGYCDERGTDEYNLALGNKRAYSVKQFLLAEGVDASRLKTISYGKERPVCSDHDESCYRLNRRVHFDEK